MAASRATALRLVTMIMGTVIALTFLFGFGNVLNLALRLGVPLYVAPLVGPAVDLSVLGLLIGTRYLALQGASPEQLRPAQRLLSFASVVTLALNVAEPICAGQFGKAAFDAVGPLSLIGWAEVGPGLLQAIEKVGELAGEQSHTDVEVSCPEPASSIEETATRTVVNNMAGQRVGSSVPGTLGQTDDDDPLVPDAYRLDAEHWEQHQRPISAESLRRRLGVGSRRARALVSVVRNRYQPRSAFLAAVS